MSAPEVDVALVYPPTCDPTAPFLAVPMLTGFLRAEDRVHVAIQTESATITLPRDEVESVRRIPRESVMPEHLGTDETPYEAVQYQQLARIIEALLHAYPTLSPARIAGHSDIAPGRKTDPGPFFPWGELYALLEGSSTRLA